MSRSEAGDRTPSFTVRPEYRANRLFSAFAHGDWTLSRGFRRVCLLAVLVLQPITVFPAALDEAQVKAEFIYNFAKYIEWPAEAFISREQPLNVCAVGRDRLDQALSAIEGRLVRGRALEVRYAVPADALHNCHIVFIAQSEQRRAVQLVRGLDGGTLTVSDIDDFVDIGGGIGLVRADDRIQFEINSGALARANLKASSQLLKLARNAGGRRGGKN